ncbi:winged helix-turn-helix domain-containing protein [Rhodovibrionaceae bacterium A322]
MSPGSSLGTMTDQTSPRSTQTFSIKEARRLVLAAQGFLPSRRGLKRPDRRHLDEVLSRLGLLQIDSVNVLARAHYMPLYSRLGPYAHDLLDKAAFSAKGPKRYFEYWAHEASILPVESQPLLRWRMEGAHRGDYVWGGVKRFADENPDKVKLVLEEIKQRGALGTSDLEKKDKRNGPWWGWDGGKIALEWLFWTGQITAASRRSFERLYDLPERVIPGDIMALPTPSPAEAKRELLRKSAKALGVATEKDLRDYYRLSPADSKPHIAELLEKGELEEVRVESWDKPAYLWPDSRLPGRASCAALLSPFDPLVWERARSERLFDFHYRIEIYTPAHKRQYGYYVLPFLQGDTMAARLDLKAHRQDGTLQVLASHKEPKAKSDKVVAGLTTELQQLARWLGLPRIEVFDKGDLAPALKREMLQV